ncbi:hypothetical protein AAES_11771 [Amazona aestiva]|uniref:Protein FAM168A n=1 Tax=Amazona aestiva TaxID=12930 RepID=A0A0Q3X8N1_AMAAE|nr:hypothetical protein AAES_11771 [Amazona aestiva]
MDGCEWSANCRFPAFAGNQQAASVELGVERRSPRVTLSAMGLVVLWDGGQGDAQIKQGSGRGGEAQQSQTASKDERVPCGYPTGYPTAAPAYNPNMYPTSSPGYAPATLLMKQAWPQTSSSCATEGTFHLPVDTGTENRTYQASSAAFRYTAGTPYKVPPTQSNNAPPPYSPSPNPYQTAMYPIRSAYPQQNLYTQGAYYTQPVYAAQPHVIHHTTVVQPNSIPSAIYPAPVAAPRTNGVAMGMVAGTTMAMSAGTLLTTPQHTAIGAHPVSVPTYRAQGTPTYSYVPPHW